MCETVTDFLSELHTQAEDNTMIRMLAHPTMSRLLDATDEFGLPRFMATELPNFGALAKRLEAMDKQSA